MARLYDEILIQAPPEHVFAILERPERTPEWSTNVVSIRTTSPGPVGVGATTEAVVRVLGTQQRAVGRCTVFDRPRRLTIESRTDVGATSRSDSELVADGEGTRLRATLEYTVPGGGIGRLFDKLVAERSTRQELKGALQRLKTLAESEAF